MSDKGPDSEENGIPCRVLFTKRSKKQIYSMRTRPGRPINERIISDG